MNKRTVMRTGGIQHGMLAALTLLSGSAFATNGTYLTGSGGHSAGMGGASIAFTQDTGASFDNPAGMAFLGNRVDMSLSLISVTAKSTFASEDNHLTSRMAIPIPGGGINYQLQPDWTVGVALVGAGAASGYGRAVLPVPGAGEAKASLTIANIVPTVTYKPSADLAIGASLVVGIQQFRLNGIVVPTESGSLVPVASHGNSVSTGLGGGLGVQWKALPNLTFGASYFTKTKFGALSGYKNDVLAYSKGDLDSPSRYGVGVAFQPMAGLTVALDFVRINWSKAAGYNTPDTFNWRDQNVKRIGVAYEIDGHWTARAGYSHANLHMDSDHALTNLYAPGINSRAVTVGASYRIDSKNEVTGAFEMGIPKTVKGTGASTGTNIEGRMQIFSIAYTRKFD